MDYLEEKWKNALSLYKEAEELKRGGNLDKALEKVNEVEKICEDALEVINSSGFYEDRRYRESFKLLKEDCESLRIELELKKVEETQKKQGTPKSLEKVLREEAIERQKQIDELFGKEVTPEQLAIEYWKAAKEHEKKGNFWQAKIFYQKAYDIYEKLGRYDKTNQLAPLIRGVEEKARKQGEEYIEKQIKIEKEQTRKTEPPLETFKKILEGPGFKWTEEPTGSTKDILKSHGIDVIPGPEKEKGGTEIRKIKVEETKPKSGEIYVKKEGRFSSLLNKISRRDLRRAKKMEKLFNECDGLLSKCDNLLNELREGAENAGDESLKENASKLEGEIKELSDELKKCRNEYIERAGEGKGREYKEIENELKNIKKSLKNLIKRLKNLIEFGEEEIKWRERQKRRGKAKLAQIKFAGSSIGKPIYEKGRDFYTWHPSRSRDWISLGILILGLIATFTGYFGGWFLGLPLIVIGLIFLPWGKMELTHQIGLILIVVSIILGFVYGPFTYSFLPLIIGILGFILLIHERKIFGKTTAPLAQILKLGLVLGLIFIATPWLVANTPIEMDWRYFFILGLVNTGLVYTLWHMSEGKSLEEVKKEFLETEMRYIKHKEEEEEENQEEDENGEEIFPEENNKEVGGAEVIDEENNKGKS